PVARSDCSSGCERRDGHPAARTKSFVQAQGIADADQGDARRTAQIRQHLPDKLMQLRRVHVRLPAATCASRRDGSRLVGFERAANELPTLSKTVTWIILAG